MNTIGTIIITIASGLIGGYISYYFAQKTENYKFIQLQKQKAESIAKLFARWIKYQGKEVDILNDKELKDYFEDLNRMSLELTLWIKDEQLLNNIMLRLQNHESAKDVRNIVGDVRKMIIENQNDKFDSSQITLWPK
ncbi:MAG: hypothetical protein UR85_C0004G0058 [Candidatus Nomurabacteria bacterium GW2011_GWF2_35_66]|uniref:Uncharacterized protein n=1 Tax=Candidatus Nomurabacteria bacterium GW2011_GWE1_35_16 TaxID=1618761 RepID=A0A0G0BBH4_9BACT|nr:MAG: hypothetical protein UR55_C0002G0057 [Candidatus Nomurabacteria bacterium GW2011_GWF1_34_20]KKP63636.1 MAG: hypothetical protein UR57_C0002G0057 [Candidatus Nomurabacteria bacterium GW2011_GWE2_34_25]KKP66838.1 MAG: hypothetical protein UR64_C0002G0054 [Candidatus Nomurabacteria bacterium GW2011_GWE1_35_16]KKP83464.1 MAG: hypothetical protein UR85_C0004G0058 [Candidatus Nomurabacteria bacterium GW2011_GWF2_35_66]HAE36604.1 hypothetical protein [Candidatus Nomurabacteria bacterium]